MRKEWVLRLLMAFLVSHFSLLICVAQSDRQLIRQGNKLFKKGNVVDAEVAYRKAQEKNERNPQANYNLGSALLQQRKDSAAASHLEIAAKLETNPIRRAQAYHNMGVICQQRQMFGEAIEAYKEALRNNPTDDATRYNLELCKRQQKQQQQDQQNQQQQNQQQKQQQDQDKQKQEQQKKEEQKKQQQQQQQQQQNQDQSQDQQNQDQSSSDDQQQSQQQDQQQQEGEQEQQQDQQSPSSPQSQQSPTPSQEPPPQAQSPEEATQMTPEEATQLLDAMRAREQSQRDQLKPLFGRPIPVENDW